MSKQAKIINGILIFLSVAMLVTYISVVDGPQKIVNVFQNANHLWFLLGVICMLIYWYLEGHILNEAIGFYGPKLKPRQACKNCMIGQFFNNITPSATGGQPMQAYYMHKCGISVGFATSALLIRFIIYQISLTIISIIVLFFKYGEFSTKIQGFSALMLFGFILNTTIAIMLLLVGYKKSVVTTIVGFFFKIGAKIKLIKNLDKTFNRMSEEINIFHDGLKEVKTNKKKIAYMLLFSSIQLIMFFMVNVTIAGAFGIDLSFANVFTIIAGASCVQMSSSFIPLPGAAGGAELAYYILYSGIFPTNQISAAVLLWRLLTFYLPLIVGLFFSRDVFGKKNIPASNQ